MSAGRWWKQAIRAVVVMRFQGWQFSLTLLLEKAIPECKKMLMYYVGRHVLR